MADPALIDITADRRVPYTESFSFVGFDWTGSTFKVHVRQFKDTSNTPLIGLTSPAGLSLSYAGTATVSAHITAGRLSSTIYASINPSTGVLFASSDSVLLSQVSFGMNISTLAGVPIGPAAGAGTETGDDVVCWYDLVRIPASGNNEIIMRGKFTVRAGVTIP